MCRAAPLLILVAVVFVGGSAHAGPASDLPGTLQRLVAGTAEEKTSTRLELVRILLYDLDRTAVLPASIRPAANDVRAALCAEDILDRILGAAAAARLGLDSKELLPELIAGLGEDCDPLRYWLTEALRRLGPEAADAAPALAKLLHHHAEWSFSPKSEWSPDGDFRDAANLNLVALAAIGPAGLRAVRESLPRRSYVRPGTEAAIRILERIQTGAPPPAPKVPVRPPRPYYDEDFEELKKAKARDIEALLKAAADGTEEQSREAFAILAWLGTLARPAGPRLFELLTSEKYWVRSGAARALGETGFGDPAWVPDLVRFLDDPDLRSGVVKILGAIGPPAAMAREKLVGILLEVPDESHRWGPWDPHHDPHTILRAGAARALGRIGGPPEGVVPHLLTAGSSGAIYYPMPMRITGYRGPPWHLTHRSQHADLGAAAADAIGDLGIVALPLVRASLQRGEESIRGAAAVALSRFPSDVVGESAVRAAADSSPAVRKASIPALSRAADEAALRALTALLGDDDANVRKAALEALEGLGPRGESIAPGLVPALTGGDREDAYAAFEALWKITADAEGLLVPATAALLTKHPEIAGSAAWRLGELGPRATGAVPALAGVIGRCRAGDRRTVCVALGKIAPEHPASAAAFRILATDEDSNTRREAIRRIGATGLSDPGTVDLLIGLMDDSQVSSPAVGILVRLAPENPEVLAALANGPLWVRGRAATMLAEQGFREEAVGAAIALIDAEGKWTRKLACKAIAAIGNVEQALDPLRKRLEVEEDLGVKLELWPALASTGPEGTALVFEIHRKASRTRKFMIRDAIPAGGEHAVPRLREWLRSRRINTWYGGAVLLGKIGEPAHVAIPDLVRMAGSGKGQRLEAAIYGLSLMGAPPEVLLPLLGRGLRDGDGARLRAGQAFELIGPVIGPIVPDIARAVPFELFLTLNDLLSGLAGVGEEALPALPYLLASIPGSRPGERAKLTECLGELAAFSEVPRTALLASLGDPSPRVRLPAVEALAARFADDAAVKSRLGRLLGDPDEAIRLRTAALLAEMGEAALPALPDLVAAAEGGEREVSRQCLVTLASLTSVGDIVRPRLTALAKGPDPWRAHDALAVLGRLDVLREAVEQWDWRVRTGAVKGLAALADRSPEARALLAALSDDPCFPVRYAARRVISEAR